MAALSKRVALHDVNDAEAFVQATINASRRVYSPDERDELLGEGLAILCKLADEYKPRLNGYTTEGRFSGYAARFLPLKLEDAYHRLHPEHRLVTHPDGKRRYEYGEKAVSLEALTGDDPDRQPLLSHTTRPDNELRQRVGQALDERWERKREMLLDVADLLGQGATWADVAHMLGLTTGQVREAVEEIMLVADRLRGEQ